MHGEPLALDSVPTPTGLFELGRDGGVATPDVEGEGFTMHEAPDAAAQPGGPGDPATSGTTATEGGAH